MLVIIITPNAAVERLLYFPDCLFVGLNFNSVASAIRSISLPYRLDWDSGLNCQDFWKRLRRCLS